MGDMADFYLESEDWGERYHEGSNYKNYPSEPKRRKSFFAERGYWRSCNGVVEICEMSDIHLLNVKRYLENIERKFTDKYDEICNELGKRILIRLDFNERDVEEWKTAMGI